MLNYFTYYLTPVNIQGFLKGLKEDYGLKIMNVNLTKKINELIRKENSSNTLKIDFTYHTKFFSIKFIVCT